MKENSDRHITRGDKAVLRNSRKSFKEGENHSCKGPLVNHFLTHSLEIGLGFCCSLKPPL